MTEQIISSERCIKKYPAKDETSLWERMVGDRHVVYESDYVGPNSANATDIRVRTDTFNGGAIVTAKSQTSFKLGDVDYLVKASMRGLGIEKKIDGKAEQVPEESADFVTLSNVYQSIHKEFFGTKKCPE